MTDEPLDPGPSEPLTVRCNRTTGAWLLVIGLALLLILLVQDVLFDPRRALAYLLTYLATGLLVFQGASLLIRTEYFTYDPYEKRLVARTAWGGQRVFPRPGYEWIAYSTGPLQIREVAADGRSRRIPVSWFDADREDWSRFLNQLHDLSEPAEPETND